MTEGKLSQKEAEEKLKTLSEWEIKDEKISKVFIFADFVEAMKFVNAVAELAEKSDHHPDILINYKKVTLTLWTHSAGGLTEKDFSLAEKINKLSSQ